MENKIIKEFYRRFTHDWPPVFYTEEEMPKIAKKVADYFEIIERGNKLIFIGRDTWPVAGIIGRPITTFLRRLIHTRKIMRYKNWFKETGIKIEFSKD